MDKEARFFERIVRNGYWQKMPSVTEQITFGNRTFFSKYKRIDAPLDDALINRHRSGGIVLAHALVDEHGRVPFLAIDYNGGHAERFYHHAGRVLSELGYNDLVTFRSKTPEHLHLYVALENAALQEAIETGKMVSKKLEEKMTKAWRVLPCDDMPDVYNILNLPFEAYTPFKGSLHA